MKDILQRLNEVLSLLPDKIEISGLINTDIKFNSDITRIFDDDGQGQAGACL
jgi:hypothetical protein